MFWWGKFQSEILLAIPIFLKIGKDVKKPMERVEGEHSAVARRASPSPGYTL